MTMTTQRERWRGNYTFTRTRQMMFWLSAALGTVINQMNEEEWRMAQ